MTDEPFTTALLLENFSYSAKKNTYEKNLLNPDNSL